MLFLCSTLCMLYLATVLKLYGWNGRVRDSSFFFLIIISDSSLPLYLTVWMESTSKRFRVYVC